MSKVIVEFINSEISNYKSSKVMLDFIIDYKSKYSKEDKKQVRKHLVDLFKDTCSKNNITLNSNVFTRYKKLVDLGIKYSTFKLDDTLYTVAYIYNIESIINTLEYISTNEDKCEVGFKEALKMINEVEISKLKVTESNNELQKVIKSIKRANKIIESEVGVIEFSYANVYKSIKDNLATISEKDREQLIILLQSKVD